MDIPVTGNVATFGKKLIAKNYKLIKQDPVIYSGKFSGESCAVILCTTEKTKTIWKVVVIFDKNPNWYSLKDHYYIYQERLTKKYGEPYYNVNFFSAPYYEGDGYEIVGVKENSCHFMSVWNITNGKICLTINELTSVDITYEDEIGVQLMEKEKEEQSQKDI